jgi:hypothetical protein
MTIPPPDPQVLAGALAPRTLACAVQYGQRRWDVTVAIDTTGDEIVDVAVRGADDAGFRACVEDAAWDLTLDARFARFTRAYDVRVAGAR